MRSSFLLSSIKFVPIFLHFIFVSTTYVGHNLKTRRHQPGDTGDVTRMAEENEIVQETAGCAHQLRNFMVHHRVYIDGIN